MRYLLVILLCFVAPFTICAQTDSAAAGSNQPDARIMFQSKVRQLTSYLNEGNESAAGILFKDVTKAMEGFIQATQAAIDSSTSGADKRKFRGTLDNQRQLLAQFQSFKPDLIRNRQSIDTWTRQFEKTLYP